MYRLIWDEDTQEISSNIERVSDRAIIPNDPGNLDYVEYLNWVAEGNTPLPPSN